MVVIYDDNDGGDGDDVRTYFWELDVRVGDSLHKVKKGSYFSSHSLPSSPPHLKTV